VVRPVGVFYQTVLLASPEVPARRVELKLLVDTGATWTWIPETVLRGLGLTPTFTRRIKLADGRVLQRNAALALITIGQETLPTLCLFGDDGSDPLLGAVTLEEFGLGVDPVGRTLIPVTGHLAIVRPRSRR
jgi:clan AA aspartic protease